MGKVAMPNMAAVGKKVKRANCLVDGCEVCFLPLECALAGQA